MITVFKSGFNYINEHRRFIFNELIAPGLIINLCNIFAEKNRGREDYTLATLGLDGRLRDESFKTWLKTIGDPEKVEDAAISPTSFLIKAHLLSDYALKLIIPTITVAFFYLKPESASLTTSLKNLLSHSAKASRVALPILNKIAQHPQLSNLLNVNVIVCAPIAAKLLHMGLICLNANSNHRFETLKNLVGHFTQGLEIFSNLMFSLYNLGTSTTLNHTIANVIYSFVVNRLLPSTPQKILSGLPHLIAYGKISATPDGSWISYLTNLVCYYEMRSTYGLLLGFDALIGSLQSSSKPYNAKELADLFTKIQDLIPNTETFERDVTEVTNLIQEAFSKGAISANHAKGLKKELLHVKCDDLLKTITQEAVNSNFGEVRAKIALVLEALNHLKDLKVITIDEYFRMKETVKCELGNYYEEIKNQFRDAALKETGVGAVVAQRLQDELNRYNDALHTINDLTPKQLSKHFQTLPDIAAILYLKTVNWAVLESLKSDVVPADSLTIAKSVLKTCYERLIAITEVKLTKSPAFFALPNETKKVEQKSHELFGEFLFDGTNEQHLLSLFGKNGIFNKLAEKQDGSLGDDYLVSLELHFNIFNAYFNWYLEYHSKMNKREKIDCEHKLLIQEADAQIDLKSLLSTDAILALLDEENRTIIKETRKNPLAILRSFASSTISALPQFDYRRSPNVPVIPKNFEFATYSLPYYIGLSRMEANSPIDTWTLTNHLPAHYRDGFSQNMVPPFCDIIMKERKERAQATPVSN